MTRTVDTLFVACTRPAMRWGVPYAGLRVNFLVTSVITTLMIQSPIGFAMGFFVHLAMRQLCRHDPHFFRRWQLYFLTKARSKTRALWGGSRLQPTYTKIRKASELQIGI